jgi:hypothetical protein
LQLAVDLAVGNTPAEEAYRTVHRWIDARRANRSADELALRKALQADHPVLFRYLKQRVEAAPCIRALERGIWNFSCYPRVSRAYSIRANSWSMTSLT